MTPAHIKKNTVHLAVGRKGTGKSTLATTLAKGARRLIILDPQGEYDIGVRVNSFSQFSDMLLRYRFSEDIKIRYFPQDKLDIKLIFAEVCNAVYDFSDVTFLIEELGYFMSATSFPATFARLVMGSRHQRINIIGVTQRATKIPRDLRSQADAVYTFQQVEPLDIKYISEFMDLKNAARVKSLTDHHFIEWLPDGSTTVKKINLPKSL